MVGEQVAHKACTGGWALNRSFDNLQFQQRRIMDDQQLKFLVWKLKYGDDQERRSAAYKLGKSKNSAVVPLLIAAVGDEDSSVRQHAIDGLFKIGNQEALDFLDSNKIKRIPVTHANPRALVILGSLMMLVSLSMPLRGNYLIEMSRVESYGSESNLTYSALIGFIFIFFGLFKDGTPGKRYAPLATIFPAIAIINLVLVFIETERLIAESNHNTTLGIALPLCAWGALFLFAGCLTVVHNE